METMYMPNGLNKTGIYFLIKGEQVVYIGKTTVYPMRLKWHISQKLEFDTVKFIECAENRLSFYEKRWINRFNPYYNISLKKPRKNAVKKIEEHRRDKKVTRYHMKFRKLTRLSKIGFGPYYDRTVGNMIEGGKYVDICQMYFNLSHITFFDDVLDELKITAEWRIEKPGTDKPKGYEFTHAVYPDEMVKRRSNAERYSYRQSKATLKQVAIKDTSKSYHQGFNHGR